MADEPKEGTKTSSWLVVLFMIGAPVVLLIALIIGVNVTTEPRVKDALVQAILYVVGPSVIGTALAAWKYIDRRGDVSVAKVAASVGTQPASSTTVNIGQKT
jgi:hypothetical protein